jgi:hypothetical protein
MAGMRGYRGSIVGQGDGLYIRSRVVLYHLTRFFHSWSQNQSFSQVPFGILGEVQ